MRRPVALLAATALALSLAACSPEVDDDVCVPPSPSPSGAPWVEADDGERCVPDGAGGWTEAPGVHRQARHPKAKQRPKFAPTQRTRAGAPRNTRRTR